MIPAIKGILKSSPQSSTPPPSSFPILPKMVHFILPGDHREDSDGKEYRDRHVSPIRPPASAPSNLPTVAKIQTILVTGSDYRKILRNQGRDDLERGRIESAFESLAEGYRRHYDILVTYLFDFSRRPSTSPETARACLNEALKYAVTDESISAINRVLTGLTDSPQ